jgi:hypothetical protein
MTGILNALFASLAGGPTETTVEYLVIAGGGGGGGGNGSTGGNGGGGAGGYRTNFTSGPAPGSPNGLVVAHLLSLLSPLLLERLIR